jgi:hypothetical protein
MVLTYVLNDFEMVPIAPIIIIIIIIIIISWRYGPMFLVSSAEQFAYIFTKRGCNKSWTK